MEFFEEIETHTADPATLKGRIRISSLPRFCRSIDSVISDRHDSGEIYSVWGQFRVSREEIRNGVRFAFVDCPHAFAWTVTCHENRKLLVVHCTIDDREADRDFVESIEEFVTDWGVGLATVLSEQAQKPEWPDLAVAPMRNNGLPKE